MTAAAPTVSVVVPCYCYGRFLEDCVRSVLDQEGVDVRVLVIDDASPDDSAQVAARLAAEDDRVEVRRHDRNRGHIATYNEGLLDWAAGKHTVLISADDMLAPGSLARSVAVLDAYPQVGFVYGHVIDFEDGAPRRPARTAPLGVTIWPGHEWLAIVCRLGHTVVSGPSVMVRTAIQRFAGGYLAELPHTADVEMWMRLALCADVAYLRGVDQAYYREHGAQMTTARVPLVDLQQRKAAYDALFDAHGDCVPDAAALRRAADRELAREALWRACRAYERRRLGDVPVDELVAFALGTYPDAGRLPEHRGLQWRRRVGPRACPYLQPVIWSAVNRRVRKELWLRRWARQGV
jgi:hypothetical protein